MFVLVRLTNYSQAISDFHGISRCFPFVLKRSGDTGCTYEYYQMFEQNENAKNQTKSYSNELGKFISTRNINKRTFGQSFK